LNSGDVPTLLFSISLKLLSVLFHLRLELGLSKRIKDLVAFVLVVLIPNWRGSVGMQINTANIVPYFKEV
jgi:hypothetical protein